MTTMLGSLVSFNGVLTLLALAYLAHTGRMFAQMMHPHWSVSSGASLEGGRVISAAWARGTAIKVSVSLGTSARPDADLDVEVWRTASVKFGVVEDDSSSSCRAFRLVKTHSDVGVDDGQSVHRCSDGEPASVSVAPLIIEAVEGNGTAFAHFEISDGKETLRGTTPLVQFLDHADEKPKRRLLEDFEFLRPWLPKYNPPVRRRAAAWPSHATRFDGEEKRTGYWKPRVSCHLVADWTDWPVASTPASVLRWLRGSREKRNAYLPVFFTDQLGMTREDLVQVNASSEHDSAYGMKIEFSPITVARWQFNAHMDAAMQQQRAMGFPEKDVDDIRRALTETPPLLMVITLIVSTLHILFDVLAFKADISFWRSCSDMKGLSARTIFTEFISQIVIFAYLQDQGTTLLVLAPSGIAVVVQAWKCFRVVSLRGGNSASKPSAKGAVENATEFFDKVAMGYMVRFFVPLIAAFSLRSLVYDEHPSYYSWLVGSLAGGVYAFGFIMMTPQLFINYKLKSVASLPWRFLFYRSLNTFIDDLFAFIIRMPTMHRAACKYFLLMRDHSKRYETFDFFVLILFGRFSRRHRIPLLSLPALCVSRGHN